MEGAGGLKQNRVDLQSERETETDRETETERAKVRE